MTQRGEDGPDGPDEARGEAGTPADDGGRGGDRGTESVTRVSVTVDEEHLDSLPRVVEALRERGMRVDAVLEGLGMVTGSAPDTAALRQVEGVSAVDAGLEHQLPPPDDDVQ